MFSLFLDLGDWEVLRKLRERQIDFYVEEDGEMPGFFKGYINCKSLFYSFTSEENAHRAILAEIVGHHQFYEDVK